MRISLRTAITATAAGAAALLLLSACGGSSTGGAGGSFVPQASDDSSTSASASPAGSRSTSASTSPSGSGSGTSGGVAPVVGELTKSGTKLAVGKSAQVMWADKTTDPASQLQITVDTIVKGSLDDFAGSTTADKLVGYTPYYVNVSYLAITDSLDEYPSPYLDVRGKTSAGASAQTLITIGFDKCSSPSFPKAFTAGIAVSGCRALVVPDGQTLTEISFPVGPASADGSVTWTA
jgi:hypothetical protein